MDQETEEKFFRALRAAESLDDYEAIIERYEDQGYGSCTAIQKARNVLEFNKKAAQSPVRGMIVDGDQSEFRKAVEKVRQKRRDLLDSLADK